MSVAYLLTGSNLGQRENNLCQAVCALNNHAGKVLSKSGLYQSPAWGFSHPDDFINQAIMLETNLSPNLLLENILLIEGRMGRRRSHDGYEARKIDIDILLYDQLIMHEEHLIIPHPLMQERRFALMPLAEIAGEVIHPAARKTINELLLDCTDNSQVTFFAGASASCLNMEEGCDAV
jgi:2-amino-4-hydroxy-6-hydroxymethyldihydropteridine diphosphokinase